MSSEQPTVFLGGTCGQNAWRTGFIARLIARGVPSELLFNPVVPEWSDAAKAREDAVKQTAPIVLFHLGNPLEEQRPVHSPYSLAQIVQAVFRGRTTRVLFDVSFLDRRTARGISAIGADIEREYPGTMCSDWNAFVRAATDLWVRNPRLIAFLGGTCGNNPWRRNFLEDIKSRGVDTSRFFDPTVDPDAWNSGVQQLEDQVRAFADHEIFFIGDPMEQRTAKTQISPYSVAEALVSLYTQIERTVICLDYESWEGHGLAAMRKLETDMRRDFPRARIFPSLKETEHFLVSRLVQ